MQAGHDDAADGDLLSELHRLDERVATYDLHVARIAHDDERARRLMQLPGVGPTTASVLVAMIGNGHEFEPNDLKCVRHMIAPKKRWDHHPSLIGGALAKIGHANPV